MNRLVLAVSFVLGLGITAQAAPTPEEEASVPTLAVGSAAPNFKLPGIDGKTHELKEYAGSKILALIFTCDHCPTAQAYEERIKKLVDDYKGKGVAFVAISPNDPASVRK
jgi:peroxiredoxin